MKQVLLVTIGFSPNIGGIETHFDDLTYELDKRGWKTCVLTYKPITTDISAKIYEKRGKNITIYRIPWIRGVFYRLVKRPLFEFLFLTPGLFLTLPLFLISKGKSVNVIHSHGLVAGFVSVFWAKIFRKKVITTTHSIYNFPRKGMYRNFAKWIFSESDVILTLSKQSKREIENLGIESEKVWVFTYWIDLHKFRVLNTKQKSKTELGWKNKFYVLFVGRLVKEKGLPELLEAAKIWDRSISLIIIGTGPLESELKMYDSRFRNIKYLGIIKQKDLPKYYSAADVLIVPSTHEEGFGRIILESLACGTPVIGSSRGAIPEALDETVGKLIDVTPKKIMKEVEYFYKNPNKLKKLSVNTREYAEKRYSNKNIEVIINSYI